MEHRTIAEVKREIGSSLHCMKRAVIRDAGWPVGYPAPMHLECFCGETLHVDDGNVTCSHCEAVYDRHGWVVGAPVMARLS